MEAMQPLSHDGRPIGVPPPDHPVDFTHPEPGAGAYPGRDSG